MVRRRGASGRVVVDLGAFGEVGTAEIGYDEVGTADDEVGTADDEPERSARARGRRTRRTVAAGVAAFLVLSAWGAASEINDRDRAQRLMSAPGGVLSLADAPRVTWSAPTESADTPIYMPGLVVVRRGSVLHGLDAGTGIERWQADVGGDPQCDAPATAHGGREVVDPLVCWGGPNSAPQVTVVRANGSVTRRTLDASIVWAAGTPDGGLATLRGVGPEPRVDQVTVTPVDGGGYTLDGTITQGQDVVVRLEDAASGTERWERTVAFRPGAEASACGNALEDATGAYTYSLQRPSVVTIGGLVEVYGCGIQAAFTADGNSIGDAAVASSGWWYAEPYVDGGILTQVVGYAGGTGGGVQSVLTGAGGTATFTSQVLNPWATDGTASDLVLAASGSGPIAAYGRDGTTRWHVARIYGELLVRADGIAVLSLQQGGVAAVDMTTGTQLWADTDLVPVTEGSVTYPQAAFTDGRVAALVIGRYTSTQDGNVGSLSLDSSSAEIIGLDLATGAVRWRTTLPGTGELDAVDGHLVGTASQQNTIVDDDGPGGSFVRHSPGTVSSLG